MTAQSITRRRFLLITAVLPAATASARAHAAAPLAEWRGVALGAPSRVVLSGLSDDEASPIFATIRDEIARFEEIFSLFRPTSALSRLNATGRLKKPPSELTEVLDLSRAVWSASDGAFDPAVQRLWRARAEGDVTAGHDHHFDAASWSDTDVILSGGAELTLNGIAQGYITDRIAALLRAQGLTDLIVDTGEQRAVGGRPGGRGWRAHVTDPAGRLLQRLTLRDAALATSSPGATRLPDGQGHILDARTGRSATLWRTVSIRHDKAAVADALSTAACCLTAPRMDALLSRFPGADLVYRG